MSDTYDTLGDESFEAGSESHEGCCCCSVDSADVGYADDAWAATTDEVVYEPVYEAVAEAPVAVSEPAADLVAYEPVTEVATYELVATPAPVVSFTPDPVVDPAAAIIGGAGTIGGGDPYGGMTIVDPAGNVVDPAALNANAGVVGPSSPVFGHGFEMVPNPNAAAPISTPRIPLNPAGDSVEEAFARQLITGQQLTQLARNQRDLNDVTSPLYNSGDDLDRDSMFFRDRA